MILTIYVSISVIVALYVWWATLITTYYTVGGPDEESESSEHKIMIQIKDLTENQNNIEEITRRWPLENLKKSQNSMIRNS